MKDFSREQLKMFEQMAIDSRSTSIDLRGVNFEPNIRRPIYQESQKCESPHYSPTRSQ